MNGTMLDELIAKGEASYDKTDVNNTHTMSFIEGRLSALREVRDRQEGKYENFTPPALLWAFVLTTVPCGDMEFWWEREEEEEATYENSYLDARCSYCGGSYDDPPCYTGKNINNWGQEIEPF